MDSCGNPNCELSEQNQGNDYGEFFEEQLARINYDPYKNRPQVYKKKDRCPFCGGDIKYCTDKCKMLRLNLEAHSARDSVNKIQIMKLSSNLFDAIFDPKNNRDVKFPNPFSTWPTIVKQQRTTFDLATNANGIIYLKKATFGCASIWVNSWIQQIFILA